jgi:hypothetical protein
LELSKGVVRKTEGDHCEKGPSKHKEDVVEERSSAIGVLRIIDDFVGFHQRFIPE